MSKDGLDVGGRPPKYADVATLSAKMNEYFAYCDSQTKTYETKNGPPKTSYKPYTIIGLCNYLGIDRKTLCEYEKMEKFCNAVKAAKAKCEAWLEEHAINGETQPLVSMFSLKNNYGWKDKIDIETTVNVNLCESIQSARDRAKLTKINDIKQLNEHIIDAEMITKPFN